MQATWMAFPEVMLEHWDLFVLLMFTQSALRTALITLGDQHAGVAWKSTYSSPPLLSPTLNAFGSLK